MNNYLWLEILVIIAIMFFFTSLITSYIYKKVKHIPTGDCAYCAQKKNQLVKDYRRTYKK